eukprot:COSAG01_NODE_60473_length_294_cov_1.333333_1_plen_68_part_01
MQRSLLGETSFARRDVIRTVAGAATTGEPVATITGGRDSAMWLFQRTCRHSGSCRVQLRHYLALLWLT